MELTLHTPQHAFVADGNILLDLSLTNSSGATAAVPVALGSQPFAYTVLDSEGKDTIAIASLTLHEAGIPRLMPPPNIPALTQELAAGASLSYIDDLTSLLAAPLAVGRYLVEAAYHYEDGAIARSQRVPLEVKPSRPVATAQTLAQKPGTLVTLECHDQKDGSFLLRKRQSDHRFLGRFHEMRTLRPSAPALQIAVSVEADYGGPRDWRWIAWLEGNALFAGVARSRDLIRPTPATPIGLADPVLLPCGYGFNDAGALFIVTGRNGAQPSMRLVRIHPQPDRPPECIPVELAGLPTSAPEVTLVWNEAGTPELLCFWQMGVELAMARFDAATGAALSPLASVFRTERTVLAAAFPAVIRPGKEGHFQTLLAPGSPGRAHTFQTGSILDTASQAARDLPPFPPPPQPGITRWILPSTPFPGVPVLAVARNELWQCGAQQWRRLASGEPLPESVRLWAIDAGTHCATWFDAARGYQSIGPLPAM